MLEERWVSKRLKEKKRTTKDDFEKAGGRRD